MRSPWIVVVALLAPFAALHAAPSLLRDFNQGPATFIGEVYLSDLTDSRGVSWAIRFTPAGDRLFFVVYNETTGAELWVTDGRAHGASGFRPPPAGPAPRAHGGPRLPHSAGGRPPDADR